MTSDGDRVRIDGLEIHDETAARLVSESSEPDAVIADAIEIGARVLDREQTAANTEFVKTEFEKVSKNVEVEFGDRAKRVAEELQARRSTRCSTPTVGPPVQVARRAVLRQQLDAPCSTRSSRSSRRRCRSPSEDLRRQFSSADGADNPLAEFKDAHGRRELAAAELIRAARPSSG